MTPAEKNLRECQRQLDMDGVEVGVSRQALDEVLAELERLRHMVDAVMEHDSNLIDYLIGSNI